MCQVDIGQVFDDDVKPLVACEVHQLLFVRFVVVVEHLVGSTFQDNVHAVLKPNYQFKICIKKLENLVAASKLPLDLLFENSGMCNNIMVYGNINYLRLPFYLCSGRSDNGCAHGSRDLNSSRANSSGSLKHKSRRKCNVLLN